MSRPTQLPGTFGELSQTMADVRRRLAALESRAGAGGSAMQGAEATPVVVTSTSYVSSGPAVEAIPGTSGVLLVHVSALLLQTTRTVAATCFLTFAASGGRTVLPLDVNALEHTEVHTAAAQPFRATRTVYVAGCVPGQVVYLDLLARVTAAAYTVDDQTLIIQPL